MSNDPNIHYRLAWELLSLILEYPISIDELLSKADALMYAQKRRRWRG